MHRASHVVGGGLDPSVKASQRIFKSLELLDLKEHAPDSSLAQKCNSVSLKHSSTFVYELE